MVDDSKLLSKDTGFTNPKRLLYQRFLKTFNYFMKVLQLVSANVPKTAVPECPIDCRVWGWLGQ
jgi:hypothetical protein